MKKNKLSNVPSENSSPLFGRRKGGDIEIGDSSAGSSSREGSAEKQVHTVQLQQNNYETIERITVTKRGKATGTPNGSSNRDPGYETIPGDKCRRDLMDSLNAAQDMAARSRNSAPAGELIHFVEYLIVVFLLVYYSSWFCLILTDCLTTPR